MAKPAPLTLTPHAQRTPRRAHLPWGDSLPTSGHSSLQAAMLASAHAAATDRNTPASPAAEAYFLSRSLKPAPYSGGSNPSCGSTPCDTSAPRGHNPLGHSQSSRLLHGGSSRQRAHKVSNTFLAPVAAIAAGVLRLRERMSTAVRKGGAAPSGSGSVKCDGVRVATTSRGLVSDSESELDFGAARTWSDARTVTPLSGLGQESAGFSGACAIPPCTVNLTVGWHCQPMMDPLHALSSAFARTQQLCGKCPVSSTAKSAK